MTAPYLAVGIHRYTPPISRWFFYFRDEQHVIVRFLLFFWVEVRWKL